ncbi:MAG: M28 family peptidase [Bacteroidia bacterium]|nr:M28 family peptidase [Bacteroidia bacterium]
MRKALIVMGLVAFAFACGPKTVTDTATKETRSSAPADPAMFASTITEVELRKELMTYASDEFEGRATGTPGQKKAVEYLKNQYVAMGIPSPLAPEDYFQEVPLNINKTPKVNLTIDDRSYNYFDDFIVMTSGESEVVESSHIVYAGYGIDTDNYSDYTLDVTGKIVLIKSGEPKNEDGTFIVNGTNEASKWSNGRQEMAAKRDAAKERGAKAVIMVAPELFPRYSAYFKSQAESGGGGRISLKGDKNVMHVLLASEAMGIAIMNDMANNNKAASIAKSFEMDYTSQAEDVESENVVAYIKGSESPDEYIIISAHLDHVGIQDGKVYNGADDDGSGTVAIIEIAEAFKAALEKGQGPKRSVVFLHVTGEERGLLGSRHYTDNDPIFPLENTVANLNIDMIGRIDPKREGNRNYVYLIGSDKLSTDLHNISEEVNKKYTNVELDYTYNDENDPNRFYYRSDHYNFAKNNVPIIFYFNGTHDDYHKHTDTPDKINYDLLENRTRLIFHTAWELANRESRIVVDKAELGN